MLHNDYFTPTNTIRDHTRINLLNLVRKITERILYSLLRACLDIKPGQKRILQDGVRTVKAQSTYF